MRMLPFALALFLPLSLPASRAIACEDEDHESERAQDDEDDEDADHGPRMGVELLELTPELRVFFGAPEDAGIMVSHVDKGSPAEHAGIRVGDVIYRAAGEQIEEADQLVRVVHKSAGRTFDVELIRAHEQEHHPVRLEENRLKRVLQRGLRKHIRQLRERLEELERQFESAEE